MDKFFDRSWVIKLSSITIAIMLFLMVNMENQAANQAGGGIPGVTDGEQIMEDVPLNIYYDEDNYVLTDAPETVEVNLRGPQSGLTLAQVTQDQQEVFVDLENQEAGVHYERVQHRGFQPDLRVSIVPLTVRVTLQERQSTAYPVEVELLNEDDVADGYSAGTPQVSPETVNVTAAEGVLEQVASARALADVAGYSENFTDSVPVLLYDEAGNEVEVEADPAEVEVTVPISSASKEVPLRVSSTGNLDDGLTVENIALNPDTVTVYGPENVLNDITFIDLPEINLNETESDSAFEVDIPLPDGVDQIDPDTAMVEVETTASSADTREFSNFSIEIEGLDEDLSLEFAELTTNEMTLLVEGDADQLEELERSDFSASIDLSGLGTGSHTVPLELDGPSGVTLPQEGAGIDIILSNGDGEADTDDASDENAVNDPETEEEENTPEDAENNNEEDNIETNEQDSPAEIENNDGNDAEGTEENAAEEEQEEEDENEEETAEPTDIEEDAEDLNEDENDLEN